jgi:hypothetical protein
MAFALKKCKGPEGLPLIEIPDGPFVYERLSPGTIREPDHYDLFRKVRRGSAEVLVACPRNKVKGNRCQVPLRVLRIRHDKKNLPGILKECKSGALSARRAREIEQILKDVGIRKTGLGEGYDTDNMFRFVGPILVAVVVWSILT